MRINNTLLIFISMSYLFITSSVSANILLFGLPGAGKGTFANSMLQKGYVHFSLGDQVKKHIKENTSYGQKFSPVITRAYKEGLVPEALMDEVRDEVFSLIEEFIMECQKAGKHFILDNPIRSAPDEDYLLKLLTKIGVKDLTVVYLTIDPLLLGERVSSRRVCFQCDAIYNLLVKRPERENFCDVCGEKLFQRKEDAPDLFNKRLEYYKQVIVPSIEALKLKLGNDNIPIHTIDAGRPINECLESYLTLLLN
jgi:adenylate kinase